jgi:hypothetical protein
MSLITITNESLEEFVFAFYSGNDSLQAMYITTVNITSSATKEMYLPPANYMMHIYKPGLFGLISIRTRLSCGYGFPVRTGLTLRANRCDKDKHGNTVSLVSVLEDGEVAIDSRDYHFGDMILNPKSSDEPQPDPAEAEAIEADAISAEEVRIDNTAHNITVLIARWKFI